jgi:hypothetical protein
MCIRKYNFLRLPELLVPLFLRNIEPAILTYDILYFFVMTAKSHDFISFLCFSLLNHILILHIFRIGATLASYSRRSEFVSRHDELVSRLRALFFWFLSHKLHDRTSSYVTKAASLHILYNSSLIILSFDTTRRVIFADFVTLARQIFFVKCDSEPCT